MFAQFLGLTGKFILGLKIGGINNANVNLGKIYNRYMPPLQKKLLAKIFFTYGMMCIRQGLSIRKKHWVRSHKYAEPKKYRNYLRYFLQNTKITAKNIVKKTGKKIWLLQIFAIFFAELKKFRKYLRYFLRSAKITAKILLKKGEKNMATAYICDIFCGAQKLPQIIAVFFAKCKKYR